MNHLHLIVKVIMLVFWLILIKHINGFSIEQLDVRSDVFENRHVVKKSKGQQRHKRYCSVYPFDVPCHGRCPSTDNEWKSLRTLWNCSSKRKGATYHCTEDIDGNVSEACGIPISCDKGKGVVIEFPPGHTDIADIKCEWCPEGWFSDEESKMSDTHHICNKMKWKCGYGMVKCDEAKGVERHWTDTKCQCDISNYYFPAYNDPNNCTFDRHLLCFWNGPCTKSTDGFDQIYTFTSNGYECQKGCKEGFDFKTPQSKICEAIDVDKNGNGTVSENVTARITNSMNDTSPITTSTTTDLSSFTTTTHESIVKEANGESNSKVVVGCVIGIGLVISGCAIYIGIGVWCKNRATDGRRDDAGGHNENVHNRRRVSALHIVFCWPCYKEPVVDSRAETQMELLVLASTDNTANGANIDTQGHDGNTASRGIDTQGPDDNATSRVDIDGQGPDDNATSRVYIGGQGEQRWIDELSEEMKQKKLIDIQNLPEFIGQGWEAFAEEVGLKPAIIDQIKEDFPLAQQRRNNVIQKYIQFNETPTVYKFLKLLTRCPASTYIDWKMLQAHINGFK